MPRLPIALYRKGQVLAAQKKYEVGGLPGAAGGNSIEITAAGLTYPALTLRIPANQLGRSGGPTQGPGEARREAAA